MRLNYILFTFLTFSLFLSCKDTPKNTTMQGQISAIFPIVQALEFDTTRHEIIARFFDGQHHTEAFFDKQNQRLLRSQHHLAYEILPKIVRDSLETDYPDATFSQNDEVRNFDEKGQVKEIFYFIELETATEFVHLEMLPNGTIFRKVTQPLSEEELMRNEEEGVEDE